MYYRLIIDIVGIDVMEVFCLEYEDDFYEFFRIFEIKKMVKIFNYKKDNVRIGIFFFFFCYKCFLK